MSADRIAALEAQLAAAQATIRDQARALAEHAEREAAERRRKEARAATNRQNYERRKALRPDSDRIQTLNQTDPSFSSPPLDGSPLSSQTQHSPLLYPLPASSSPSSGLADARPPVSDTSADELPVATEHAEDVPEVPASSGNHSAPPKSSPPDWPPALRLEVQAAPKAARTRKPSAAERLYLQLEATRKARCEERGVAFVAEDWAPARQNTQLGPFAKLPPHDQERFEASWAEYLSDDKPAAKDPPWGIGFFLASKSTWESRALRGAS